MRPVAVPILTARGVNLATVAACSTVTMFGLSSALDSLLASVRLLGAAAVSGDLFCLAVYSLRESLLGFVGEWRGPLLVTLESEGF